MKDVCETLLKPFLAGMNDSGSFEKVIFFNAVYHPELLDIHGLSLQQFFKPDAAELQQQGLRVVSAIPDSSQAAYDAVLILAPKNRAETRYLIARGLQILKPDGMIFVAADNKAGGGNLKKMLQQFGLENVQSDSKNKAKVVWGNAQNIDQEFLVQSLEEGCEQEVLGERFISQPGVFGWDKIDEGSDLLLQHLDDDLHGSCADFGCGYGFLSAGLLQKFSSIQTLVCVDADYRAIQLCQKNIQRAGVGGTLVRYFWDDLTSPSASLADFDFIIMNPPFHKAHVSDADIGIQFIRTAHNALRRGGVLWMVANAQLPYEETLGHDFTSVKSCFEGQGFKVIRAVK